MAIFNAHYFHCVNSFNQFNMENNIMNFQQLSEYLDITVKSCIFQPCMMREGFDKNAAHYRVTIISRDDYFSCYYSVGSGHFKDHSEREKYTVEIEDILLSLQLDSLGVENNSFDFNTWCDEYGYDNDSIKVKDIFDKCEEHYREMEIFFGKYFQTFLECTEDDPEPTQEELSQRFDDEIMPFIIKEYGVDDEPAKNEAFNNWTDSLCKDGEISDLLYNQIEYVGKYL